MSLSPSASLLFDSLVTSSLQSLAIHLWELGRIVSWPSVGNIEELLNCSQWPINDLTIIWNTILWMRMWIFYFKLEYIYPVYVFLNHVQSKYTLELTLIKKIHSIELTSNYYDWFDCDRAALFTEENAFWFKTSKWLPLRLFIVVVKYKERKLSAFSNSVESWERGCCLKSRQTSRIASKLLRSPNAFLAQLKTTLWVLL